VGDHRSRRPPNSRTFALAIIATSVLAASLSAWVISLPTAKPDFAILWGAMQVDRPYDPANVASYLGWRDGSPPATFVYAPSAIPIFAAFGQLSLGLAITLWGAVSGAALALSSRSPWAPLLLLAPAVLWALPGGQTTILVGALTFGGLQLLHRPAIAGVLFGLGLSLKPQLVLLIPLALLLARQWRPLLATAATFLAMSLLSALLFGPELWISWLQSLPDFLALHEANNALRRNEIAFGLPAWLRALAVLACAILTARAIQRQNPVGAFVIAAGCALIASPHAMGYEFAVLAPAYICLIAQRGWSASATIVFIITPILVWAFGDAILPFMPRLIALVMLVAATIVDAELRREERKDPALA
jgi:hypothetical protein